MITKERILELQAIVREISNHASWPCTPAEDLYVLASLACEQLIAGEHIIEPPIYDRVKFLTTFGSVLACLHIPALLEVNNQPNAAVAAKAMERLLQHMNSIPTVQPRAMQ